MALKKKTHRKSLVQKSGHPVKKLSITGKYVLLQSDTSKITTKDIDKIADQMVTDNLFWETAVILNGIDPLAMTRLIAKGSDLGTYIINARKIAEAQMEKKLTNIWLSQQALPAQLKAAQEFLSITNPKFSARYRAELAYNLAGILTAAKEVLSATDYVKVLDYLQKLDKEEIVWELDQKLN